MHYTMKKEIKIFACWWLSGFMYNDYSSSSGSLSLRKDILNLKTSCSLDVKDMLTAYIKEIKDMLTEYMKELLCLFPLFQAPRSQPAIGLKQLPKTRVSRE